MGIPLHLLRQDIKKTIDRFGVFETDLTVNAEASYEEAAREVFAECPETAIFCYGHTHRPMVQAVGEGLLINSGTWLKRLHRRDGIIGLLPPIFYPFYQLCAVRIAAESEDVTVQYEAIEKPSPGTEELTLTERLLALGRTPSPELPDQVVVEDELTVSPPEAVE